MSPLLSNYLDAVHHLSLVPTHKLRLHTTPTSAFVGCPDNQSGYVALIYLILVAGAQGGA